MFFSLPGCVSIGPVSAPRRWTHRRSGLTLVLASVAATACDLGTIPDDSNEPVLIEGVALELIIQDFRTLTQMESLPGDDRLYVVEKAGVVHIVEDGEIGSTPFLDLQSEIGTPDLEQGLLGLAFHPDYASNGRFFVSYTDVDGDSRVVEYHADPGSDVAEPGSAHLILHVPQPHPEQNGGHLAFGPDGMLYIGLGDGGGFRDPDDNAQDPGTLLGSLLRIDVDGESPYEIPGDNPFVGTQYRGEVWARGLHNPSRFSWDPPGSVFYVSDVGENAMEEVNFVEPLRPGVNFGWPLAEGGICYTDEDVCTQETYGPAIIYDHGIGCAIIGGVAYRGSAIPQLAGQYIFGDRCDGWVRAAEVGFPYLLGLALFDLPPLSSITAIAEDSSGEVYFLTFEGALYKLVPSTTP